MWHAAELVLILLLLAISESMINVSPHPVRRSVLSFLSWVAAFAVGILLLSSADIAAVTAEVGILVLAAYMFRWLVASLVDYVRAPQLFETPRRRELELLAHEMIGAPMDVCARSCAQVLRDHDPRMALLGLIGLIEGKGAVPEDLAGEWGKSCENARSTVLDLQERSGGKGSTNALFLAQLLCMYEPSSVGNALNAPNAPALRGRRQRIQMAHRLAKTGRVRRRAEEYGLPVEQQARGGRRRIEPVPLKVRMWPGRRLASLGYRGRGMAFGISHVVMIAYGIVALAVGHGSGWVFLGVAALMYVLALTAMSDFLDLVERHHEAPRPEGKMT